MATISFIIMPLHAALVEDDAHRVLQLVRGAKAHPKTQRRENSTSLTVRHRHVPTKPSASLAQEKTRALLAVYGLRHTERFAPTKAHKESPQANERDANETRRELLETRRRIYRNHFSGLQATHGPSGRPKLETLIDAAMDAKRTSNKHTTLAIGAAVLTSANRIYTSGRLESAQDAKFNVCAERAALLKVLDHSNHNDVEVVEALVVCSDQRGLLPVPCGACREFLAEFGDFPVFLLNAENDSQETRSFELFPLARHTTYTTMATNAAADVSRNQSRDMRRATTNDASTRPPHDARDWTCEQVAQWLRDAVELPQYADVFMDKRVDGATLWHLADSDLQLLLGIVHPLHRRRLVLHLDRLRDRVLLDHGIDFAQLTDYVAVLDRERFDVVAQLKQTFDRLDANCDGRIDAAELVRALQSLGVDRTEALAAQQLLQSAAEDASGVNFPVFVQTFSRLAQLPAGETRDACKGSVPAIDLEALRATFDRADTNKSGTLDETELIQLLQSLGRVDCERRATEWFAAVDGDGDGRLSFAEFFHRYAQLNRLDLSSIRAAFDAECRPDTKTGTIDTLVRMLQRLFPHEDTRDIHEWCTRREWTSSDNKALTYADAVLACVMYGNALRLRVAQLLRLQQTLENDALCHRSRIVHLQQSGHVRLCKHPGGDDANRHEDATQSLGERRRKQMEDTKFKPQTLRRQRSSDDDGKESDDYDDHVVRTFRRFASQHKQEATRRHGSDDDRKQQHSDEDEARVTLNAVETAQALLELGVVWSRDQLLRYLDREGFGIRRTIHQREFVRLFTRLHAFQKTMSISDRRPYDRDLWEAIGHGDGKPATSGKAKRPASRVPLDRKDYDAYLRAKHARSRRAEAADKLDTLRSRRRCRNDDMGRDRRDRPRRHHSSSSSSRSESDCERRGRPRQGSTRQRSRRRQSNTSTGSSSSASSRSRSRSRNTRGHSRGRSGKPFFRGFEVGDRVTCRDRGAGTLVQLHRDYFVAEVRFDSGENAKNIELSHLKRVVHTADSASNDRVKRRALVVGASVRVAHKGTRTIRRGTIHRCRTNGTYDVVLNELGEQELLERVPLAQLILAGKPIVYSIGAHVTVKKRHEYRRGVVALCRTNGTYDVRLRAAHGGSEVLREVVWELLAPDQDDGADDDEEEEEKRTPTAERRRLRDDEEEDDGKQDDDYDDFEPEFRVGDHVEARFQGQETFYGGRVTRVHSDGTCDIVYHDGDAESRVRPNFIRPGKAPTKKATNQSSRRDNDGYDDDFESD